MILDNWFAPYLLTPKLLLQVENSPEYSLISKIPKWNLRGIVHTSGTIQPGVEVMVSQGVRFHTDPNIPFQYTILLIMRNDGYQVEDTTGSLPQFQQPGAVFVLDHHRQHRLKSINGKTQNKYWAASYFLSNRATERQEIETQFQTGITAANRIAIACSRCEI